MRYIIVTKAQIVKRATMHVIMPSTVIFILLSSMVVGYDYIISNLCWIVKSIIERV